MKVWLLSADFFFSSQITGDIQRAGFDVQQVANAAVLLENVAEPNTEEDAANEYAVLIDLTTANLDLAIVGQLKGLANAPKAVLAFGPHVAEAQLAAAADAGCDHVLTKGQAHREIAAVLSTI